MKKLICTLLCVALLATSFAACSKSNNASKEEPTAQTAKLELVKEIPQERITDKKVEAAKSFAGGKGTKDEPYEISDASQLQLFANLMAGEEIYEDNKSIYASYYVLTDDIVINADDEMKTADKKAPTYKWDSIGAKIDDTKNSQTFRGVFDGAGHSISGIYQCVLGLENDENESYCGLFDSISGATIKNLKVNNSYFYVYNSARGIGGITGNAFNSRFENCQIDNVTIFATQASAGGVVGETIGNIYVKDSTSDAKIECGYQSIAGGICGSISDGEITNCISNASVLGTDGAQVGGVVGFVSDTAPVETVGGKERKHNGSTNITNCKNNGTVESSTESGGVVGHILCGNSEVNVVNCSNAGQVKGAKNTGGVVGYSSTGKNTIGTGGHNLGRLTVSECTNSGIVFADDLFAGVVGYSYVQDGASITFKDCVNTADLTGDKDAAGVIATIASRDDSIITVNGCKNTGAISAKEGICSGVIGQLTSSHKNDGCKGYKCEVKDCINEGAINAGSSISVAGIIGTQSSRGCELDTATVSNCVNKADINCAFEKNVVQHAGGIVSSFIYGEAKVRVAGCKNEGDFNVKMQGEEAKEELKDKVLVYIGGISGKAWDSISFDGCSNTGKLIIDDSNKKYVQFDDVVSMVNTAEKE